MLAQNELHTWNDMDMTLNIMCSLEYNKNGTWFAIISLKSILILKWHTIESWCKHNYYGKLTDDDFCDFELYFQGHCHVRQIN